VYGPGDVFTVSVTVRDPSGIEWVGFSFTQLIRDDEGAIEREIQRDFCGQRPEKSAEAGSAGTETWTYECEVPDPIVGGEYRIWAYAQDRLGNWTNINNGRAQLVFGSFTIADGVGRDGGSEGDDAQTSESDVLAPVVGSVSVSPGSVDVSSGSAEVVVSMEVSDALSGVRYLDVWFAVPGGGWAGVSLQLASGTVNNGVWSGALTVPRYAKAGTWSIAGLQVSDVVGNTLTLETSEQVSALVGVKSFTVTAG